MPTGYTSFIEEGKVKTGKQFLHLCLRNFGVCMNLRDTSLSLKEDYTKDLLKSFRSERSYHKKHLAAAMEELEKIKSMSDDELYKKYVEDTKNNISEYTKYQEENKSDNTNYLRIAEEIKGWDCDPEFNNIKEFALNQIDMSMHKHDYWEEELKKCYIPTMEEFMMQKETYLHELTEDAESDIEYHTEELEKIKARQADCMSFYKKFKQELNKLK